MVSMKLPRSVYIFQNVDSESINLYSFIYLNMHIYLWFDAQNTR